jgi:hypothetical protein
MLLISLGGGAGAAKPPPPVSAHCRITCVVEEKIEWKTDGQSANDHSITTPHVQTGNSTPVLIINSNHESMLEMGSNGKFYSGNFPIDIIVSVTSGRHAESQENSPVTTIIACWKI